MSSEVLPPAILRHISRGESERVADLLLRLDDAQRRALIPALTAHLRAIDPWSPDTGPLFVAGAACMPTAAQMSAWFARSKLEFAIRVSRENVVARQTIRVLLDRNLPWYADLSIRLSATLSARDPDPDVWRFAADLVTMSGAAVPTNDGFVLGWFRDCLEWSKQSLYDRLHDDPLTDVLLPRVFDIDRAGRLLNIARWSHGSDHSPGSRGHTVLAALVLAGRLDRAVVLDGTVTRLLRGDDRESIRAFASLHDDIAPTVDELAGRVADYVTLLPDGSGPVAALAQRALRRLDEAGRLDAAIFVEASEAILVRSEKALLRAQLSWIDAAARRDPAGAGPLVACVSLTFGEAALDIQDRAVAIAIRHADRLAGADRTRVTEAVGRLGGELHARAVACYGDSGTGAPRDDMTSTIAVAASVRSMPEPIGTTADLAAAVVAYLGTRADEADAVDLEQILDGLVRLSYVDIAGVVLALQPIRERYAHWFDGQWFGSPTNGELWVPPHVTATLAAALGEVPKPQERHGWNILRKRAPATAFGLSEELPYPDEPGPARAIVARLDEITAKLLGSPVPFLLATPTHVTGHIATATLVERIAALEAARVEPWPYDLEQALLRLPYERDDVAAEAAGGLRSEAGRRAARHIADGPSPTTSARVMIDRERSTYWAAEGWELAPWTHPAVRITAELRDAGPLATVLLTVEPGTTIFHGASEIGLRMWPVVLPSHREVIAAHALPYVSPVAELDQRGPAAILPLLVECSGPARAAITLALAYGLGARHLEDRTATIDAFTHLASAGDLDPDGLGIELGAACTEGKTKLNRVVAALAEIARIGHGAVVGRIALAALAEPLARATPPQGTPALLELATKHHTAGADTALLPQLAQIVARPGTNRLVTEARRLQRLLLADR